MRQCQFSGLVPRGCFKITVAGTSGKIKPETSQAEFVADVQCACANCCIILTLLHLRLLEMEDTASHVSAAPDGGSEAAALPALHSAESDRDVANISSGDEVAATIASQVVVTFEKEGPLGLVLRDDMLVADTAPGSASRTLGVEPGCYLTHVGDREVSSIGGLQDVLAALRSAPRPLSIKLRRPKEGAAAPVAEASELPPSLAAKDAAAADAPTERSTVKIAQSARTAVASAGSALKSFLSSGAQAIAAVDRAIDRAIDQSAKSVASAARATVSSSKRAAARVRTRAG